MHRWSDLVDVPDGTGPSVVTIGNFDGVHRGHAAVLARVVAEARSRGCLAVATTFDPHPLQVLYPDRAPASITGLGERLDLIEATGIDATLVQPFTLELAQWSPERYVETVFVRAVGARAVVIGRDVRFGHRNAGDIDTLRDLGKRWGFDVVALDDLGTPDEMDGSRRWSSTWVRELLGAGDVAAAAAVLGRLHRVRGTVVHGAARGRTLGYPTANLGPDLTGMVPADGVYAGWLTDAGGTRWPAAISIGTNPQFEDADRRVESYVLDETTLDLYGQLVVVELAQRLRGTERFASVDGLVAQMGRDVEQARSLLT